MIDRRMPTWEFFTVARGCPAVPPQASQDGNGDRQRQLGVYDGNLRKKATSCAPASARKIGAVGARGVRHIRTTIGPDGQNQHADEPKPLHSPAAGKNRTEVHDVADVRGENGNAQLILNNTLLRLSRHDLKPTVSDALFPSSPAVAGPSITKRANCCCNSGCRTAAHGRLPIPALSICV